MGPSTITSPHPMLLSTILLCFIGGFHFHVTWFHVFAFLLSVYPQYFGDTWFPQLYSQNLDSAWNIGASNDPWAWSIKKQCQIIWTLNPKCLQSIGPLVQISIYNTHFKNKYASELIYMPILVGGYLNMSSQLWHNTNK